MSAFNQDNPVSNESQSQSSKAFIYFLAYSALFLISLAAMASYFAYDCIGPLTPLLKSKLNLFLLPMIWKVLNS